MPVCVFAERRLNCASRPSEPSRSAGSKPSMGTGGTGAWASTCRAAESSSGRYRGSSSTSAIGRALTAGTARIAPYASLAHRYPRTCSVTWASAMSAASARTRSVTLPSTSPTTKVARLPRSTTPGSSASAPKLTHASTTRPAPTAPARIPAFRPFCSETTYPSPTRRPARTAAASAVCWALTATRTGQSSLGGRAVTFSVDPAAGSKSFFTGYNNPQVVTDAHMAEQTLSTPARQTLYNYIQDHAASDAFMAFLYYSPYAYATTSTVHSFFVTPLGNYHLENVWLSK